MTKENLMTDAVPTESFEARAEEFRQKFSRIRDTISRVIVGQQEIIEDVIVCVFAGGHCLLEGVPGLGKTLLVRTLSEVLDLEFRRIQFTPDLMPADIIGTNMVVEDQGGGRCFRFQKGPIFGQIILADEINRATPKTQSALLEAMQERSVTVGGETYRLAPPFIVIGTQNPLEMDGTYPLPEAQLDRFLFKLLVGYPSREELSTVLDRTVSPYVWEPEVLMDGEEIESWKRLILQVVTAPHVQDYAVRLALATHPGGPFATPTTDRYVRYGSSPRGVQALILSAKIRALLDSRFNVSFADVRASVHPALRHRILLNFEAEAQGITGDSIIDDALAGTPEAGTRAA